MKILIKTVNSAISFIVTVAEIHKSLLKRNFILKWSVVSNETMDFILFLIDKGLKGRIINLTCHYVNGM